EWFNSVSDVSCQTLYPSRFLPLGHFLILAGSIQIPLPCTSSSLIPARRRSPLPSLSLIRLEDGLRPPAVELLISADSLSQPQQIDSTMATPAEAQPTSARSPTGLPPRTLKQTTVPRPERPEIHYPASPWELLQRVPPGSSMLSDATNRFEGLGALQVVPFMQ